MEHHVSTSHVFLVMNIVGTPVSKHAVYSCAMWYGCAGRSAVSLTGTRLNAQITLRTLARENGATIKLSIIFHACARLTTAPLNQIRIMFQQMKLALCYGCTSQLAVSLSSTMNSTNQRTTHLENSGNGERINNQTKWHLACMCSIDKAPMTQR